MLRRVIWVLVALSAVYVLMLIVTTPTPPGNASGILTRFLPAWWSR